MGSGSTQTHVSGMQVTVGVLTDPMGLDLLHSNASPQHANICFSKAVLHHCNKDTAPVGHSAIKAVHASSATESCSAIVAVAADNSLPAAVVTRQPVTPVAAALHASAASDSSSADISASKGSDAEEVISPKAIAASSAGNGKNEHSIVAALQQQVAALLGDKEQMQQQLTQLTIEAKALKKRASMCPCTYVSMTSHPTKSSKHPSML